MTPTPEIIETAAPVGVISDTHGLLRDEALALLADCSPILHLGDVGDPAILDRLGEMAPLYAIRGNVDREGGCATLPAIRLLSIDGHRCQLIHDIADVDDAMDCECVLHGHSHKPRNEWQTLGDRQRLLLNPGAAGKRRFRLPITLGKLWCDGRGLRGAIIHLPLA
ncbi:metallophosphoesterase family protein [Salinicola rhizosphaerae]|uniref:Phosphoesterase n=1 Tax=Salinicola rhizosphaerae TaxID=1443141 RepID=A0ABQ3DWD0_9GAMM|nr:metallophosphoesterase family protein [Salinicola rhizosphaerae]GHB17778.1 phosphoesterase [Salinicola rhizosphaerae]